MSPRSWARAVALIGSIAALGAASIGAASTGRAQECPEPPLRGPSVVTPSDGASGVTTDAPVVIEYTPGYFGPDGPGEDPATLVAIEMCGPCSTACVVGSGVAVSGRVETFADRLFFVPDAPLEPGVRYVGLANGLERSLSFSFCTGRLTDAGPPVLSTVPRATSSRVGPQCELPDGGYRLGLSFSPAVDDGPPGSIEYLLYLSRGGSLEAPRVVARARNYAAEEITLGVLISDADTTTPICLTLAALDGVGNATVSDTPQCFDPITRTTFAGEGCTASAGRARGGAVFATVVATIALVLGRRRGRRATR